MPLIAKPVIVAMAAAGMLTTGGVIAGATWYSSASSCVPSSGVAGQAHIEAKGFDDWTNTQVAYATDIVGQGEITDVAPRGWVIAVATAMQESHLWMYANHNVPESLSLPHDRVGEDHRSVGLFQQQPPGWGTVKELMDPATSASKFYHALLNVDDWESMPLTQAAQIVQRSAFPVAYAKWEKRAEKLVEHVTGINPRATPDCSSTAPVSADGWTAPVKASVVSGFRTPQRPDHHGVDLGAQRGSDIRAAAAGTVTTVTCNASLGGAPYSCDIDGSPSVQGCGWYVDITHAGGIITRYCHMLEKPKVVKGQKVKVGDVLGAAGTSGNSSGPHLHFEVHVRCEALNNRTEVIGCEPTDPVAFLAQRGVKLEAA